MQVIHACGPDRAQNGKTWENSREKHDFIVIAWDCNLPLKIMDKNIQTESHKESKSLNNIINQLDLVEYTKHYMQQL